jgi:glycerol-3-phosphate acyltransferase PlsY
MVATAAMTTFIIVMIIAYLIGSLNVSIGLFKLTGREDPRTRFSNNPGATNVYRLAGPGWALLVLLLDMTKAMLVVIIAAKWITAPLMLWAGVALIVGNLYPLFHGFKGGKGVGHYLGFSLVVAPAGTLIGLLAYGAAYLIKQPPFIRSLSMVLILAIAAAFQIGFDPLGLLAIITTVTLIIYAHRSNFADWRHS